MALIFVIRHGRTTGAAEPDPGLDDAGREQAARVAQELQQRLAVPATLVSSPLRRCRETAAPLAAAWGRSLRIDPRATELPSPQNEHLLRAQWLQRVLPGTWDEVARAGEAFQPGYAAALAAWRAGLHELLLACREDTVVFSHFVAVNSLIGLVRGGEGLSGVMPDHGAIAVFETAGRQLRLLELGRQMATAVG